VDPCCLAGGVELAADALVNFQAIVAKAPLVDLPPPPLRVCKAGKAQIGNSGKATPYDDRGAVDQQAIDQIGGQEGSSCLRSTLDEQVLHVRHGGDGLWRGQDLPALWHGAPGQRPACGAAIFQPRKSYVQPGRVRAQGAAADKDGVGASPLCMDMGSGVFAGQPLRLPVGEGNAAVQRQGELERHVRPAQSPAAKIAGQAMLAGFARQHVNLRAAGSHARDALPGCAGVRVGAADNHPSQSGRGYQICASRPPRALMGAGFKRNVKRCAASKISCLSEGDRLGMGAAACPGPAAADHLFAAHENRTNRRVGTAQRTSALGQAGCGIQPATIVPAAVLSVGQPVCLLMISDR